MGETMEVKERHAVLERGKVYKNKGGGEFRCNDIFSDGADVTNIKSGWRCLAHNITLYDDGTIEWDYSTKGYFDERKE